MLLARIVVIQPLLCLGFCHEFDGLVFFAGNVANHGEHEKHLRSQALAIDELSLFDNCFLSL